MIKPFTIYNEQNAPEESKPLLAATKSDFGMIPNLEGVMALAPKLLASYVNTWDEFKGTSLSNIEQQVVYLTVNYENNCEYCVPWHSYLAKTVSMPEAEIENLRQGAALSDPKLNALHQFTKTMVRTNGSISPADADAFYAAGFTEQQALEVVLGIAIKVMSNFTNALAQTSLDDQVKHLAWKKPNLRFK